MRALRLISALLLCPLLAGAAAAPAEEEAQPETFTTKSGLQYVELAIGEGPELRRGDTAKVHYSGWLADGTLFDSSRRSGSTFSFKVGRGRVIAGWDEGVVGMQIGGKRRLIVPPKLGYGARGAGGRIPPDSTLVFEIELIGLE
jgi:FKBP-type peptidyl-prolyl cis-trans isomerase FkpA